ncbi:hypothetical protein NSP_10520 [Nodularia spumigena CCY9414]|nr:hypothetical protein NSP_10520 [Nodularia spumigena CCY9414]
MHRFIFHSLFLRWLVTNLASICEKNFLALSVAEGSAAEGLNLLP